MALSVTRRVRAISVCGFAPCAGMPRIIIFTCFADDEPPTDSPVSSISRFFIFSASITANVRFLASRYLTIASPLSSAAPETRRSTSTTFGLARASPVPKTVIPIPPDGSPAAVATWALAVPPPALSSPTIAPGRCRVVARSWLACPFLDAESHFQGHAHRNLSELVRLDPCFLLVRRAPAPLPHRHHAPRQTGRLTRRAGLRNLADGLHRAQRNPGQRRQPPRPLLRL